jgi:hypothetical protein
MFKLFDKYIIDILFFVLSRASVLYDIEVFLKHVFMLNMTQYHVTQHNEWHSLEIYV